ncbi:MAG: uracil phosphoribosyltransferase [Candidatus Kapabacteria bacterium]|nr:uracil phosphoribosyltransferase [Ignavibacteriota bacterium]MCW5884409.1 uracil phosphoribosyltransferase [Candidatus Kapabacteria bacterium]
MIEILNHPLVLKDLTILRDKNSGTEAFRNATYRIGLHLAIAATSNLALKSVQVDTPMETTAGAEIRGKVIIIPVLRAGLGLVSAFQEIFPDSVLGYIGLRRDETTFSAEEYYYSMPEILPEDKVIILEIMLATGGSTSSALSKLQLEGAENMTLVSIISAPEGLEKIRTEFPKVSIISAALDRELNDKKYILPGLGDAGDRYSGM